MKKKKSTKRVPKNLAVGDLMRKNAYIMKGKQKIFLKVSPSAVTEYISRIIDNVENNLPQIAEITHRDNRKTIMVKYTKDKDGSPMPVYDDITKHFGRIDSKIVSGSHIYCTRCLKEIEKVKTK